MGKAKNDDRHQQKYAPVRISSETNSLIESVAKERGCSKSEIIREAIDRGLTSMGAKGNDAYMTEIVEQSLKKILQPSVERLAAISAKAAHITAADYFMNIWFATRGYDAASYDEIEQVAQTARQMGIEYLKLKGRDIDDFIAQSSRKIMDE